MSNDKDEMQTSAGYAARNTGNTVLLLLNGSGALGTSGTSPSVNERTMTRPVARVCHL